MITSRWMLAMFGAMVLGATLVLALHGDSGWWFTVAATILFLVGVFLGSRRSRAEQDVERAPSK